MNTTKTVSFCGGKVPYDSEGDAIASAQRILNRTELRRMKAYTCDLCSRWHLSGHIFSAGRKCPGCGSENIKKFGFYKRTGRERTQRYWCYYCQKTFSVSDPVSVNGIELPTSSRTDKADQIAKSILEGNGVRETSRLLGVAPSTVTRIKDYVVVQSGKKFCQCGKPVGHIGFCHYRLQKCPARMAYLIRVMGDINETLRLYVPKRDLYERPDIPNERETDIPLLVTRWGAIPLDAPVFDGLDTRHEFIRCNSLAPDEILMMKEEHHFSEERERRIEDWERWMEKRGLAFRETIDKYAIH